jgi:outer membrane protein, heavy metal efflux system
MTFRHRAWILVLILCMTGCQTYQRRPLRLDHYAADWAERSLDIESIQSYADAIDTAEADSAPFNSADGLSLAEAEAVALHFNPSLRLARAQADVPLASAKEAGWWPDPQLEVEVLRYVNRGKKTRFRFDGPSVDGVNSRILGANSLGSGGLESTPLGYRRVNGDYVDSPWLVGAGLSFTIPIFGRLAVEKDLRWSEYTAAWRRILVSEWELLTSIRESWLRWSTLDGRVRVTTEYIEKLEIIANIAQRLSAAGELKPTEARVLRIELARQRNELLTLENAAEQERLVIFALMGVKPGAPVELHPQVMISAIDSPPDARHAALLDNHPRLKAASADYEATEQALRLEIRSQYPDLQIGPSYSLEEGFSRLGIGIGFPIPLWNRNRQGIAQAFADREAARAVAEAEVEFALSELAQVESRLQFAVRQREYLLETVAPLVDKQLDDSRTLLDLGEVNVLLLRDALTSSLETKLNVLTAMLAEARAANVLSQMLQPRLVSQSKDERKEVNHEKRTP